jgi:hypothetical protein
MELLSHFEFEDSDIIKVTLKDDERDIFLSKLPDFYREAYIAKNELDLRVETFESSHALELSELVPDKGSIRSGDFGEVLSYLFFKERHQVHGVDGPLKWRWKQDKNTAAPYSDVILFACPNVEVPCVDDLLVSVESKMKATESELNQIQKAIDGAESDYVSRIANSLAWMKRKYKIEAAKADADTDGIKNIIAKIERFINADEKGPYQKKVKAIAFIDQSWFEDDLLRPIAKPTIQGLDLTIFAVSISKLKEAYNEVLTKVVGTDE